MKKLLIVTILFAFLSVSFFSCQKDGATTSSTSYYIKGKKDGTAFNFTTNTMAMVTVSGPVSLLNLIAFGNGSEGFNIGLNFSPGSIVQVGTYSEDHAGTNYIVGGVYNPNSTTTIYSAGIQYPSAKPLIINVLTKTSTEITGTFSGAFYRQAVGGTVYADYITITEGEFKLKLN